jgi:hypothetical protein
MNRFASAESDLQQLSVVKHNLECGVRECEELLQSRRWELENVVAGLQNVSRVMNELWDSVVHSTNNTTNARFEVDSGSVTSVDSG